jgi:hypothetical protein
MMMSREPVKRDSSDFSLTLSVLMVSTSMIFSTILKMVLSLLMSVQKLMKNLSIGRKLIKLQIMISKKTSTTIQSLKLANLGN